jgi:acetyltransferase-like isoleucine patch superfamily enzyme
MWLNDEQLRSIGLAALGSDVSIEESVLILGAGRISIGSHVRIDAFSVLSAGPAELTVGDHVHLAVGVRIFAGAGVTIASFASLSAGVCVYSASDDYSGGALTNPTIPIDLRDVTAKPVSLGRHAIVGAGSVILPGVCLGDGASVGALTLVHRAVPENAVFSGNPMRQVGTRDGARLLALEAELLRRERPGPR